MECAKGAKDGHPEPFILLGRDNENYTKRIMTV